MQSAYHIAIQQNPDPGDRPTDLPYRPPTPGIPGEPPDVPMQEPPVMPPATDVPNMPIPGPITL